MSNMEMDAVSGAIIPPRGAAIIPLRGAAIIPPRGAAIIPLRDVGVPPVPLGARAATGPLGWPDQMALKRVSEMLRAEAGDTPCTAMAQAQVALAEACEHWSEGHMLAMAEALDVAAGHWNKMKEKV